MTLPSASSVPGAAVIDGVDVGAVAAAVLVCPGVAALDSGQFGEVASYLPGRKVAGVMVSGGRVKVQVRVRWAVPAPDLARKITAALVPLTGHYPVDVVIADIDDPPGTLEAAGPRAWETVPGTRAASVTAREVSVSFDSGCE
jgi:hypothetical protein